MDVSFMIKKIEDFIKTQNLDTTTFNFKNNCFIKSIIIKLTKNYVNFKNEEIIIKYAQNGITSDLIALGKAIVGDTNQIEITVDTPVSATDIFITANNKLIKNIEIFELSETKIANCYPYFFDTDLKDNYFLDTISVFTSSKGYCEYSVYTSKNGRDFEFLVRKTDNKHCDSVKGDTYDAKGKEARIIRVYIEYNSVSAEAPFEKIKFTGSKSQNKTIKRPQINIPNFNDTKYAINITTEETINEVYDIITRQLGCEYKKWFDFELCENPNNNGCDFFKLSFLNNKINIKGNCGISLATGINYYLKYFCKVNISQVGKQTKMPENIIPITGSIFKETKAKIRYAYNYCTFSYTMAFWGEKEWRDELDWLALNGVNVVLDITAQEEVWRRFLTYLDFSHEEIIKFIAGPAYYAWAYMSNLWGFGGPVHDSWFIERTELARRNHLIMRKLGIQPVLQGYSGMIPSSIIEHDKTAEIIPQGTWCSFERPAMLKTTSKTFKKYAEIFYKAQTEVYGAHNHYYATDPFHEGGNMGNMSAKEVSFEILSAMIHANSNAVWVIQSWQKNPTAELLLGIKNVKNWNNHALVLDLYAEKSPNHNKDYRNNENGLEFDHTPWIFCMLNNFGGRLGLHGHIDNLVTEIPNAYNKLKNFVGIGITPEASFNNPILYDFLFETVWQDDFKKEIEPINLTDWISKYIERRYGKLNENLLKAWIILLNTVYKAECNMKGQGAPESIINARPSLTLGPASSWGNISINYNKENLKEVAKLLTLDYESLKNSSGYTYDLISVLQQILSNTALEVHAKMSTAFYNNDLDEFKSTSKKFFKIADLMDEVLSHSTHYLLGSWIEQAKALAQNTDDFTKMIYEFNAKALITTWGSYNQCEKGGLKDYSNRQWSGLIKDFYKPRWEKWVENRINELEGKPFEEKINWFEWEWNWVRERKSYCNAPSKIELISLSRKILSL